MNLLAEPYTTQAEHWPRSGKHILAQFDAETIVVYQAYRPGIGRFALEHQCFGGEFSFSRMSWIKPNFLWMMYRSGWGTKEGQETTLAIRLQRQGFDEILRQAVHSSFTPAIHRTTEEWRSELRLSSVRLQWDPDHDPTGTALARRAIQVGLSGDILRQYSKEWIVEIEDISAFVAAQRPHAGSPPFTRLTTPAERIYPISNPEIQRRIGSDAIPG